MTHKFMDLSIMQKRKIILQFEENNIFFELTKRPTSRPFLRPFLESGPKKKNRKKKSTKK